MFQTILVPTDGSVHAGKALQLATDIAEKYTARLVLLHVVPSSPLPEDVRRMARSEHIVSEARGGAAPLSPEGKFPASTILVQKPNPWRRHGKCANSSPKRL
jgi:nucleotide-binding universal stress UspA family protein